MNSKRFGKNLLGIAVSRGISLVSSVFAGFFIPKILSVPDYGMYKLFSLYAVYTALLHFGFADGILLKFAGKDYNELNRPEIRTYTKFFIIFETAISLVMTGIGLLLFHGDYCFIVIMLALNMVFVNVTTYYQFLSQAVQRFNEYSFKSLIASVLKLLFVLCLWAVYILNIKTVSYRIYLIGLNVIDLSMIIWYIVLYRDITFGDNTPLKFVKKDIIDIFRVGITLTLAYQISHLVLALDRQFVSIFFDTETFAVYSFGYNIVSMISTMISSLSVVLLPMLKKETGDVLISIYKKCTSVVALISSAALFCYFPLTLVIEWFLPQYAESIDYIAIVLPAFTFSSTITIVYFTLYKVLNDTFAFFRQSCFVLCLGLLTDVIAYYTFKSPEAISFASLIVMIIWFVVSGGVLKRKTRVGIINNLLYLLLISLGFLLGVFLFRSLVAECGFFMIWFLVCTVFFYHSYIKELYAFLNNKLKGKKI